MGQNTSNVCVHVPLPRDLCRGAAAWHGRRRTRGAPYLRAGAANFDARTTLSTGLAIDRIERALRLTNEQDTALKGLEDASTRAAGLMKANCQPDQTLTPTGRVGLMDDRLSAMLKALDTVQSVLVNFYDSLSDEQKARFNRLGVEG